MFKMEANDEDGGGPLTSLDELTAVIDLDPDNLVREVERFTGEYSRQAREAARATRLAALAALQAKRVEARLTLQVKHTAELTGQKMTEKVLSAAVLDLDAYNDAKIEEIEAAHRRDLAQADLRALDKKSNMLDLLARREIAEIRRDPSAGIAAASAESYKSTL